MANATKDSNKANAVNAAIQNVGAKTMVNIGPFNIIDEKSATCDAKIARLIYKSCRNAATKAGIHIPGNAEHIKIYNEIFNLILSGRHEEVKAVYKKAAPAGSLSQVGPIMPKEAMMTFRKCINDEIYTVKVDDKPAAYMEKIDWQLANGMREPRNTKEEEHVRPGGIWECCRCNAEMATPEPILQPFCAKCAEESGKGKAKGSAKRTSNVALEKELRKYAGAFLTRRDTEMGQAILVKINEIRTKIGLPALNDERIKAAAMAEDLM